MVTIALSDGWLVIFENRLLSFRDMVELASMVDVVQRYGWHQEVRW